MSLGHPHLILINGIKRERPYHSEPFCHRPVVGSPADAMAEEALQSVGMVHDAPPIANVVPKTGVKTRGTKRKKGAISAREVEALD